MRMKRLLKKMIGVGLVDNMYYISKTEMRLGRIFSVCTGAFFAWSFFHYIQDDYCSARVMVCFLIGLIFSLLTDALHSKAMRR